jgi:hypothetical protein
MKKCPKCYKKYIDNTSSTSGTKKIYFCNIDNEQCNISKNQIYECYFHELRQEIKELEEKMEILRLKESVIQKEKNIISTKLEKLNNAYKNTIDSMNKYFICHHD